MLGALGLFVAAGLTTLFATFVARAEWRPGGIPLPWGLVLGVAGQAAIVVVGRLLAGRPGGFAAGAGWAAMLLGVLAVAPGGDVLVAGDALGMGFLLASVAAVLVVLVPALAARR